MRGDLPIRALGLPIKVVTGYKGSTGILAALERKELEGMNLSLHFVQDRYGHFIENGTIRPFLAIGTGPGAEAPPGVATLKDLTLNSDQRKLADFLIRVGASSACMRFLRARRRTGSKSCRKPSSRLLQVRSS